MKLNKQLELLTKKKKKLDSYRPFPYGIEKNLGEWFDVELTYSSNAIEGSSLSRIETAEVMSRGIAAVISGKPLKDQLEAINHAKALEYVKRLAEQRKSHQFITEMDIKAIHKLILTSIIDNWAGKYRQSEVFIKGSNVEFPMPHSVPHEMQEFAEWLKAQQNIHPVRIAADAHFRFVKIHPFVDGNGRVSRLLMNLVLLINGYPITIIRNEDRTHYLHALEHAHTTKEMSQFYAIVESSVDRSLDRYLKAVEGKKQRPWVEQKETVSAPKDLLKIGEVASLAQVSIPTVRYYINLGLLTFEKRSKGGFMLFNPKVVEKIAKIKYLQKERRLSIAEIIQEMKNDTMSKQ